MCLAVLGMSSGWKVFCSDMTFCLHHGEMTWENTQITAWCLSRESIYTRWHGTHAGGCSLYRGTIGYGLCPHVDSSLSVLSLLNCHTADSQASRPLLLFLCAALSEVMCCRINTQTLLWHCHDKWLKLHFCHKRRNDQTPGGQKPTNLCYRLVITKVSWKYNGITNSLHIY